MHLFSDFGVFLFFVFFFWGGGGRAVMYQSDMKSLHVQTICSSNINSPFPYFDSRQVRKLHPFVVVVVVLFLCFIQ